ncbi:hypothetical protein SAMN05216371_8279 [Streptomyces sp. TLI_053]|uniref:hypothetical protein n=1 Tax=Streptomyces sp. TLI_053 TaxID=1855352 RepID=UPI000879E04E|nr:hypothetical protein [Streptomyces sp. TLI_053]SDT83448.1 hypothetical protein SAMN05216371_8279 [Streptomyces sp. TLI_053]
MTASASEPDHDATGHDVPPEQAVMVVDMKGYSRLPEVRMAPVRADLDSILETVFAQSGLPAPATLGTGYRDTGDGVILLLPPRHTARLVDPLLANLSAALQRYAGIRMAGAPVIRLRTALHVGPLSVPDGRGTAINDACRLVNSDAAYQAVAAATDNGLFLAAVLSEPVYRRSVQAGRTGPQATQDHFLAATARVADKPGFEEPCRLLVPGLPTTSLRGYLPDPDSAAARPSEESPAPPVPDRPARAGAVLNFNNALNDPVINGHVENLRIVKRGR